MDCYIVYRKGLVANMKKILSGQIKYEVRRGGGGGASYFPLFFISESRVAFPQSLRCMTHV